MRATVTEISRRCPQSRHGWSYRSLCDRLRPEAWNEHSGSNQARRTKGRKAAGKVAAPVRWNQSRSKSIGSLNEQRTNQRQETSLVCGGESKDVHGFQKTVGEGESASEERRELVQVKLAADFSESAGKPGKPIIGMGSEGAAMGLQLFVRRTADVVIIDLHGKATIGAANDILRNQLRRLIEDGTSKVLVNLTDLTQLDSSSIGTIVSAFMSLKRRGANLKLLRPRGNVKLVLETVRLLTLIPSIEDESEAIASFN
jgi:anti-sigma B factor antagonist